MASSDNVLFIGVDGGGTRCRAALSGLDLQPIATSERASANVHTDFNGATETALAVISDLRITAETSARIHVHLGLAGVVDGAMAKRVRAALPVKNVTVSDDRATTVAGVLAGNTGSVVSIGTGSFIARVTDRGARFLGGWGFRLGDQASGAWLGHRMLMNVLLALDGILPPDGATRDVSKKFSDDPTSMLSFAKTAAPAEYAQLAPIVVNAAQAGDVTAVKLMQEGARYIKDGLKAIGHQPDEPLCLAGGLGAHYAPYLGKTLADSLTDPQGDAVAGALRLAISGYRTQGGAAS